LAWKIWKPADERLREEWDKAISLRNQSKWKEASDHFLKVSSLSEEARDPQSKGQGPIAYALAMLYLAVEAGSSDSFSMCHNAFSKIDPETILEIPYEATAREIAEESMILSGEHSLPNVEPGNVGVQDPEAAARRFEMIAQSYMNLGRETLVLGDLLKINPNVYQRAFRCLGLSRLLMGLSQESRDPDKAVQYYSEAVGYFTQAGLEQYKSYVDDRNRKLASVAKCWFCGRNVQGEEVHYVYIDTLLTGYLRDRSESESPLPTKDSRIAACLACYEAIRMMADRIAKYYHELAMAAMNEMQRRLSAQIASLEEHVRRIEDGLRRVEHSLGRLR